MSPSDLPLVFALVFVGGLLAGMINAVVGSGTLITFPVLLLLGVPPVMANVSNTIGLVPGAAVSVWEYRRTLVTSKSLLARIVPFTLIGAIGGSLLLVTLPTSVFDAVVPALIALALIAIVFQPWIQRAARARLTGTGTGISTGTSDDQENAVSVGWVVLIILMLLAAYGGYFGAAQGILLLVTLSVSLGGTFGHVNGMKNVLGGLANLVASIVFIVTAWSQIDWVTVGLISAGSIIGGAIGARSAKRLPPLAYRIVVLAVGAVALGVSVARLFEP